MPLGPCLQLDMSSITDTDIVVESLSLVAEKAGDITPAIYETYFKRCPESAAVMSHCDPATMGKMMEEVYRLMMVSDYSGEEQYLNWEVINHEQAYNVASHMYEGLFTAMLDTVRETLAEQWNISMESAWSGKCHDLQREIVQRFTVN